MQAWQSIGQAEEAIKQGRSIMNFTVVTIIFVSIPNPPIYAYCHLKSPAVATLFHVQHLRHERVRGGRKQVEPQEHLPLDL